MAEKPCTLIFNYEKPEVLSVPELRKNLENPDLNIKTEALKTVITQMLNGELLPQLLMTIIRFVMPVNDHKIKKLLLIYWEIVDKTNAEGKLMQEFILVCNALRNDLIHPNEYVRGATLRFICKLKEPDILEPLLPSIKNNLEDKHAYVRRTAVLALYNVYKNFDYLCPDAPDIIYNLLLNEGDASCKRNMFIMLFNTAQDKAIQYLSEILDQVSSMGEIIQIIIVELIRKVCRTNPNQRSKYLKCIFTLLGSGSSAVQYEAAGTLISLSTAPTAIKAAATTFIDLLVKESDNNVKMIVLDRIVKIKGNHPKIIEELLMDVLRALASPSMDIRSKTLEIALDLISAKNIEQVILVLKKEIAKTQSKELDKASEYRQLLIQTIHQCAVKFPDIASSVVPVLMDFLGDPSGSSLDVIMFIREVVEMYPDLRDSIIKRLLESLQEIKSSKVFRAALWIIGEYTVKYEDIVEVFATIRQSIGNLPFVQQDEEEAENGEANSNNNNATPAKKAAPVAAPSGKPKVNIDGTYARQSAMTMTSETSVGSSISTSTNVPQLRGLLFGGDFFLGTVLCSTLTKLVLKVLDLKSVDSHAKNLVVSEVLLISASIISLGQSNQAQNPIDLNSYERIIQCIRVLTNPTPVLREILLTECRASYTNLLTEQKKVKPNPNAKKKVNVQADDLIKIPQLKGKRGNFPQEELDGDDTDLTKATGLEEESSEVVQLNRVYQLTGFSDPIYAEAFVNVHQYDIVLDVTVMNQTPETLQNVALELATLGDLKLVERPQNYTIGPHSKIQIKANIKVSSTETGIIFGNIVYDVAGVATSDKNCVILNDIHIDIMDYISPATCNDIKFRTMWAEFEWENKVAVNTNITDPNEFLRYIVKSTNMNCLTPDSALAGDSPFLSANLYAKSVFGEDALANVSIEKQADGKIGGFIRIRSKTQGIALSLGDKISMKQRITLANDK